MQRTTEISGSPPALDVSLRTCSSDAIELISSALLLRLKIETRLLARDVSIRSNRRVVSLRNED
jgi:hypothetical protein